MNEKVAATGVASGPVRFFFISLVLMALVPISGAYGQQFEEEDPAELDALYEQAHHALASGRYDSGIDGLDRILASAPDDFEARQLLARGLISVGKYDRAEKELRHIVQEADDLPGIRHELAELLLFRGKHEESLAILEALLAKNERDFRAGTLRGRLLEEAGKRKESQRQYTLLHQLAQRTTPTAIDDLLYLGMAMASVQGYSDAAQVAKEVLDLAKEIEPLNQRLFVERGYLYLSKYQSGDAINYEFQKVLQRNPNYADARVGLAAAYLYRFELHKAEQEVKKALAINPNHPQALLQKAYFAVDDYRFSEAKELATKALTINPRSREAQAYLAAAQYLLDNRTEYEATCKKLLEQDPSYGELYHIVANLVALLRRYEEARTICEKSIELDPSNWSAMTSLGKYCFNSGHEEAGHKHLQTAQDNDPFRYAWRLNMLEVADFFSKFVSHKSPRFDVKIHVDEAPVLKGYLIGILEDAYTKLTEKYQFEPENPTVVEMFPHQNDFAVRTVGFEGIQGVLGACFGRVMTLNSPQALPPGSFVWARTSWHEFAHVLTLQLSSYRVPRWLTEGLSVYEEGQANPVWARDQDFDLINAYENEQIIKVLDLNSAFRSPRILMAYYQSGLLCGYLADTYGFDKIIDMLKAYGEGFSTERVFPSVFGRRVDEIDADFLAHIESRLSKFKVQPIYDRGSLEKFRSRTQDDPEDFDATIHLAAAYLQHGNSIDFGHYFSRAMKLNPTHRLIDYWKGEESFRKGKFAEAERAFLSAEKKGVDEFFLHQRLAILADNRGKKDEAIARYKLARINFPAYLGPKNPYTELANLYAQQENEELAMAELARFVEQAHEDFPTRITLAEYYIEKNRKKEAYELLRQAIYINPFDRSVHIMAGDCLRDLKNYDDSIREFEVARELSTDDLRAEVQRKLAQVFLAANRPEEARFELNELLRTFPGDEEALRMLSTLGE